MRRLMNHTRLYSHAPALTNTNPTVWPRLTAKRRLAVAGGGCRQRAAAAVGGRCACLKAAMRRARARSPPVCCCYGASSVQGFYSWLCLRVINGYTGGLKCCYHWLSIGWMRARRLVCGAAGVSGLLRSLVVPQGRAGSGGAAGQRRVWWCRRAGQGLVVPQGRAGSGGAAGQGRVWWSRRAGQGLVVPQGRAGSGGAAGQGRDRGSAGCDGVWRERYWKRESHTVARRRSERNDITKRLMGKAFDGVQKERGRADQLVELAPVFWELSQFLCVDYMMPRCACASVGMLCCAFQVSFLTGLLRVRAKARPRCKLAKDQPPERAASSLCQSRQSGVRGRCAAEQTKKCIMECSEQQVR